MAFKSISINSYKNLWDDPYEIEKNKRELDSDSLDYDDEDYTTNKAFDSFRDDENFDERDYQDSIYSIYNISYTKRQEQETLDIPKSYRMYDTDDLPVRRYEYLSTQITNKYFNTDIPLGNIGYITNKILDIDRVARKGLRGYEDTNLKSYVFTRPKPKENEPENGEKKVDLLKNERFINGAALYTFKKEFELMYPSVLEYLSYNNQTINSAIVKRDIYNDDIFFQYYPKFDKLCKSKEQLYTIMDDCIVTVDKIEDTDVTKYNRHLCEFALDILQKTGHYGEKESRLMNLLHTPDNKLNKKALFETRQGFENGENISELLSKLQD